MGLGAAFIYPTTLSIITNTFHEPSERARRSESGRASPASGSRSGPLLGGLLVENFGWQAVFLINVPVCTVAVLLAHWFVPNSSARDESPLDPLGAILSIFALVSILFGIIEAPNLGWTSPMVIGAFVIGISFLAAFIWWERHTPRPMLDVRIFKNPRFSAASATITLTQFAMFGATFLLTQYFQFRLGYSPLKSGIMLMPVAIGLMVGSPNTPQLVARSGTKKVVVLGLAIVVGVLPCYGSDTIMSSFITGSLALLVFGIGIGLVFSPVTESIMGSLPPGQAGVGSAVNDTTRQTGQAFGIAIVGSLFLAQYHHFTAHVTNLSTSASAALKDSIGTALNAARRLPPAPAHEVERLARDAFRQAMRVTYPITACIMVIAVVIAWRYLPAHAPTDDD